MGIVSKKTKINEGKLWSDLIEKLSLKYDGSIELVFPEKVKDKSFLKFHELEKENFRFELRYTTDEFEELLKKPNLLFFFVMVNGRPEILVLGYSHKNEEKIFYLDTFVVRQRGKGVGQIIIRFLIELIQKKGYSELILDTEEEDEKGIPLRQFYERNGFSVIARTETGNLTMKRSLNTGTVSIERSE